MLCDVFSRIATRSIYRRGHERGGPVWNLGRRRFLKTRQYPSRVHTLHNGRGDIRLDRSYIRTHHDNVHAILMTMNPPLMRTRRYKRAWGALATNLDRCDSPGAPEKFLRRRHCRGAGAVGWQPSAERAAAQRSRIRRRALPSFSSSGCQPLPLLCSEVARPHRPQNACSPVRRARRRRTRRACYPTPWSDSTPPRRSSWDRASG